MTTTRFKAVAAAALLLAGCTGTDGKDGTNGSNGANGAQGPAGPAGAGYLPREAAGVVGYVIDTAGEPVAGATVYLVPAASVPTSPIDLSSITAARAATNDEPLEDAIQTAGDTFARAATDETGAYRIATVPTGSYFLTVVPADNSHLPGGSLCRESLGQSELAGKQIDVKLSTRPSDMAEYVGPSVCLNCHGAVHEKQTLHALGIRPMSGVGPMQDSKRFPQWDAPLAKFAAGTTLYYYREADNTPNNDWKVSEKDPGAALTRFTATLFTEGGRYKVRLTNVATPSDPLSGVVYDCELSYGGGLFKMRWVTKLADGSRYILPIQYNTQAAEGLGGDQNAGDPFARWTWQQYNAGNWWDETTMKLKNIQATPEKSFDNACAGCHFTGFQLNGNLASGVPDEKGDYDYDGDGVAESMNVSCETCHGPGSEHWYRAGSGRSIVSPSLLTPEREVGICASCHTRAIGNGGVKNAAGGFVTEAPLGPDGRMPIAGTKRSEFLTTFVSKIDDGIWQVAAGGDGIHAIKHHQQVSDFLLSAKYRNPYDLLTCTTCHDVHGNSGLPHQLQGTLDKAAANYGQPGAEGLCLSCHKPFLNGYPAPAGSAGWTVGQRMQNHWAAKGILDVPMGEMACVDCHMPKTAKSGSGLKQAKIAGVQYWSGDIASHRFDVPRRAGISTKSGGMMAIAYTNKCGVCHQSAP